MTKEQIRQFRRAEQVSVLFSLWLFWICCLEKERYQETGKRSALISLRKCVSSKKFAQKMNAIYDAVKAEVVEIAVECC